MLTRVVLTNSLSEYRITVAEGAVTVEKTHNPAWKPGVVKIGAKFYGDAIELREGAPLVLRMRGKIILTTSVVKGIFDEKGRGAR